MSKKSYLIFSTLALFLSINSVFASDVQITNLKVEGLERPMGVETQNPRFSWNYKELNASVRAFKQLFYQIKLASSQAKIDADNADIWDSSKLTGDSCINVHYKGLALESGKTYFWKVISYDAGGVAIASPSSSFEMGLLHNSDWKDAKWIGKRLKAPATVAVQTESWANYEVETDFKIISSTASLIFRAKYATDVYYLAQITPGTNGKIDVYKVYGSASLLSTINLGRPILLNSTYKIKVALVGNKFDVYLDNVKLTTTPITDNTITNGTVGVGALSISGEWGNAQFDNFKVTQGDKILFSDDFNDGTLNNFQDQLYQGGGTSQPQNGVLNVFATRSLIDVKKDLEAPLLRKTFALSKPLKKARAYVSGIGYYEMSINGTKIGNAFLEPGYSRYDKTVYYSVYDITSNLTAQNAVGFELGRGWYGITTPTLWGEYRASDWVSEPKLKALIRLEYEDGSTENIITDETFKTGNSPILFDGLKAGEYYDARKEISDWNKPTFDDTAWGNAVWVSSANGTLTNVALNKKLAASSTVEVWGWALNNAVDGIKTSTTTSMGFTTDPNIISTTEKWISIDLGQSYQVSKINLYPRSDLDGYFPADYNIQISDNNVDWTTIQEIRGGGMDKSLKTISFDMVNTRYIRVLGINMTGINFALAELEVYANVVSNVAEIKELTSQMFQPIRIVETVSAKSVTKINDNTYFVDFGRNMAGNVELKVSGNSGTKVRMQYSERMEDNGFPSMWRFAPTQTGCYQQDIYILKGGGQETYQAKFSYKGFRYVIVTDFPGVPTTANFKAKVSNSDMPETGSFDSSSDLFNNISLASKRAIQSNVQSIPTDCPTFEKLGWTCDDAAPMEAMAYYYDIANLYEKRMHDYADDISSTGSISDVLPSTWGLKDSDPAWNGSYIAIAWKMYQYYGNQSLMVEHYGNMKKYIDNLTRNSTQYIINPNEDKGYGDWAPPDHKGGRGPEGVSLYQTVYYYWYTTLMSKMAAIIGKNADSQFYATQALNIKTAFNTRYFSQTENAYYFPNKLGGFRQAAQVLPLYFGLVPDGKAQLVADQLAADIRTRDNHLWVGILGFEYIADVLMKYGYTDLAYEIHLKNDFPSIGNMLREGATTLWESYSLATTRSLNHKMYSPISEWLFRGVAGLGVDENTAGFQKAIIAPQPYIAKLTNAHCSYNSIYGIYQSSWEYDGKNYTYKVTVPANASATVKIPMMKHKQITIKEGGNTIWNNDVFVNGVNGVFSGQQKETTINFEIGSGTYIFTFDGTLVPSNVNEITKSATEPGVSVVNNKLFIQNLIGNPNILIYDSIGRQLVNKIAKNSSLEIPFSIAGVYTVQIKSKDTNWTKKIIKGD